MGLACEGVDVMCAIGGCVYFDSVGVVVWVSRECWAEREGTL